MWTRDPKAERLSSIHSYMSDPEVRRQASLSVGYLGDTSAAARVAALAEGDPSETVRAAAAATLRGLARTEPASARTAP